MFIWRGRGVPEMKKIPVLCLILGLVYFAASANTHAFSCAWSGPFLTVAKNAPLVVRGRVLRHHPGLSKVLSLNREKTAVRK
jgi:hypothetical protein